MTYEAFIILDPTHSTTLKPEPPAEPEPPAHRGRTWDDLSPAQKSRLLRLEVRPFFYEPVFDDTDQTGKWRVGKAELHREFTIMEFDTEAEAMACLKKQVRAWRALTRSYSERPTE